MLNVDFWCRSLDADDGVLGFGGGTEAICLGIGGGSIDVWLLRDLGVSRSFKAGVSDRFPVKSLSVVVTDAE
jgi:hypothetical protein